MSHNAKTFSITFTSETMLRFGLLVLCAILLWFAFDILLVLFAGVMVGVLLRAATRWVQQKTGWGPGKTYLLVSLGILTIIAGVGFALGPRVIGEAGAIVHSIPKSLEDLKTQLQRRRWGEYLVAFVSRGTASMTSRIGGWVTSIIDQLMLLLIAVVVGFFFGLNPPIYVRGISSLIPEPHRSRVHDLFSEIAYTLRWWLVGQLIPMSVLGVGAFIGLWILGVPLPFTLALFTAVMLFIPYIGSLISLVPAALMGLLKGPQVMIWVIVVYLGVHVLEGYFVTPLAQKRAIRLPPALTIMAQLFMFKAGGVLGLVVATPLAAAILVTVQTLYYHERPSLEGTGQRLAKG